MNEAAHSPSGSGDLDENAAPMPQRGRMRTLHRCMAISGVIMSLAVGACTQPGEKALGTNVPLSSARDLEGAATAGVMIWRAPDLAEHERALTGYYIPDATVYRGRGSGFANLTPQQVDQIAADLTRDVRKAIGQHFKIEPAPAPGAFTLNLVLVRITPPAPGYISNGPYDWSSAVVGMPDAQTTTAGQMTIAGKFTDSESGKLLVSFVAPVSPQVMDLGGPATSSQTYEAAQRAGEQFASDLVAAINRQRRIGRVTSTR